MFACITVVAFAAGVILTVVWRAFRRSRANTMAKIRKRGAEDEPRIRVVTPKAKAREASEAAHEAALAEAEATEETEEEMRLRR